jgi:hypothetical protein
MSANWLTVEGLFHSVISECLRTIEVSRVRVVDAGDIQFAIVVEVGRDAALRSG